MYSDSFFGNERICSDAFSGSFFSVSVSLHSTAQHSTAQHSTAQMQTAFAWHSPGLFSKQNPQIKSPRTPLE
jgi:hypothetical protein